MKNILIFILISTLLISLNCSKKERVEVKEVQGKAFIINSEGVESIYSGGKIKDKSRIRTENDSKIEIPLDPNRKLFLNENTTIIIDIEKQQDGSLGDINVTLIKGEVLLVKDGNHNGFSITTDIGSVIGESGKYNVTMYPKKNVMVVKSIVGDAKVFPMVGSQIEVDNCQKILIKSNGESSKSISITEKDIDEINEWLPESFKVKLECIEKEEELDENKKPEWIGTLRIKAKENEVFIDTVKAKDPEGKSLSYYLEKGPKGFILNKKSGIISYKSPKPGTYRIKISVQDEDGESNYKTYYLTVPGKAQAVLNIPEKVVINTEIKLDASESRNSLGDKKGIQYRFDSNGDGKWDEQFGNQSFKGTIFQKPGKYKIRVEINDKDGKKSIAESTIIVVDKIKAAISHTPKVGKVGSEFKLKVNIKDNFDVKIRWDLNSDGKWDIPGGANFSTNLGITNIWDKKGSHPIRVELKTEMESVILFDTISVYDGVIIDSIKGPDTVSVNENIKLKCFANDEKNKIVEYAWDFAGVGLFDKKLKVPEVETTYKKSGIYTIVCAVTNSEGMSVSEIKEIIVVNADATVAAGGPYATTVNKEVLVRGMGRDPDSKIVEYLWDLDFDGKFEIKQKESTQTKAKFERSGDHKIVFGIITDDGKKIFDTSFVKVSNRAPHSDAGEDQISKPGKKIKLNGKGNDPDFNIVKYEWDFNEDGKPDFTSKDSGYAENKFEKFTKAVLKVTDREGLSSTDTIRIVICPKDMITNEVGKFCIDKYEYPNIRKKIPKTNISQKQAEIECAKKGKRLCKIKELELACTNGNDRFNYPYGKRYEGYNCNTVDSKKTQNRVSWSGQYALCTTKDGVFDMTGNVAEWAAETDGDKGYAVGGWWQDGREGAACGKFVKIKKSKGYGHVGFRCCK